MNTQKTTKRQPGALDRMLLRHFIDLARYAIDTRQHVAKCAYRFRGMNLVVECVVIGWFGIMVCRN